MRIGVIKLGARISFSSTGTSGGTGEALSIINILKTGGAEVVVFTKVLSKDENPNGIDVRNIESNVDNIHDLDALLIVNGTVQFYGGVEDRSQILNYQIINNFKGKVFYAYCDPALTLKQLWPAIESKPWAENWAKEDIDITRTDIVYLSQPHDVDKVKDLLGKNCVIPAKIIHFPFEQFPCLNEMIPFNDTPCVDLSYGGTMRGGKRVKKMIEFYLGHELISVEMFGKITKEDFTEHPKYGLGLKHTYPEDAYPAFTGSVKYADMLPKMNDAMCHVVIGDPLYEKINDIPQRLYESVWSNVVTFIDGDMDAVRRIWKNDKVLADFLCVRSRRELTEKILLLKADPDLRKQILCDQVLAIAFNPSDYSHKLMDIIKSD